MTRARKKTNGTWREVVKLRARFQRSVHLERDAQTPTAVAGYVLTPLVRTLTARILDGCSTEVGARAWSVTGPYGTGKSAFLLFLSNIVAPGDSQAGLAARAILSEQDPALAKAVYGPRGAFPTPDGLVPVLATGERRRLDQVMLGALRQAAHRYWGGRGKKPAVVNRLDTLYSAAEKGRTVAARDVVSIVESVAQKMAQSSLPGRGLLVILDEAGKVLEHAALHPDQGDVQLLQELAEAANRSGDVPIVFLVTLHQAFEQYAGRLNTTERGEWAKVQGRFEDVAFQESSYELLRLVGEALDRTPLQKGVEVALRRTARAVIGAAARSDAVSAARLEHLVVGAAPLHPSTALLLGPLFRSRIAQNERSLFAFLASNEPHGFQQFLDSNTYAEAPPALLRPDELYDYLAATLAGHIVGHQGKQWAQIETALRRLPDSARDLDAKLIKAIGLLGLFGDAAGVAASEELLSVTYAEDESDLGKLREALDRLRKASLVVFRKFRNAYQLWEGSDLDIDALVREALSQVDPSATLIQRLTRVAPPRPAVARRHLFETGTFRYFDVVYTSIQDFDDGVPGFDPNADGALFLVVETSRAARQSFLHRLRPDQLFWLAVPAEARPFVVVVPHQVGRLTELAAEIAALDWVQTHTPELHDDLVARREVSTRLLECERQLRLEVTRMFDGANSCDWSYRGRPVEVASLRDLTRLVSDLCDDRYASAPLALNELINRRSISSAAAAARRTLMEAMVERSGDALLGFTGAPPEMSMYRSLLEYHGLHRKRDGFWGFGPPIDKRRGSLRPVWDEIERAFDDAKEARLSVGSLYERLRRAPYGLKDGVIPVFLVAAIMSWKDEVALYEDSAFVPNLSGAVIERLLRQSDRFEVQRLAVTGPREALFRGLAKMLSHGTAATSPGLLPIVRQLVRLARDLSDFAKNTRTLPAHAQAVREALLRAREPGPLVFHDLPIACGMAPFTANGAASDGAVQEFVEALRAAIRDLYRSYPALLDQIEDAIRTGLSLPADPAKLRREIAARSARLIPVAVDPHLKAFLLRAIEHDLTREEWLVSMGTLLGAKPPYAWYDRDTEQFRLNLGLTCRRFLSLESMVTTETDESLPDGTALIRINVSQPGESERERVVPVRKDDIRLITSVCAQIRGVARQASASLPRDAVVAALAMVARDLMEELEAPSTIVEHKQ